jgi:hypothetical protein
MTRQRVGDKETWIGRQTDREIWTKKHRDGDTER